MFRSLLLSVLLAAAPASASTSVRLDAIIADPTCASCVTEAARAEPSCGVTAEPTCGAATARSTCATAACSHARRARLFARPASTIRLRARL